MSGVTLSAGVRTSLLALQATSEQLSSTQNRLASGRRVSSAIDNPISYFTAAGLSSRANDLNRLVDGIQQAQQAISAANAGLSALTKLVNSAKAVAQQALQSPNPAYSSIAVTGTLPTEIIASVTGTSDLTSFGANGGNLVIGFNGGADPNDRHRQWRQPVHDLEQDQCCRRQRRHQPDHRDGRRLAPSGSDREKRGHQLYGRSGVDR